MNQNLRQMMHLLLLASLMLAGGIMAFAQDTSEQTIPDRPRAYRLNNVGYERQHWNNCGPATLTNALTYFGYADNQTRAANWLKPNYEDKNVTPHEMANFVNTQVPEIPVYAMLRYGGNMELMKTLLYNHFPVIIEKGYQPEGYDWMGHYLLLIGYDDSVDVFITHDSFTDPNYNYPYDLIEEMWQHFNYTYLVLYTADREAELRQLLGPDADEYTNIVNALEIARAEAIADPTDAFAWFNMGTNFTYLGMYPEAAQSYDQARNHGLPWRMLWYQFGPFEAYYNVGRYNDIITLAQANLNDGGGQYVEETYYWGGRAREARGEYERALSNYAYAVQFNPNFTDAVEARNTLQATLGN